MESTTELAVEHVRSLHERLRQVADGRGRRGRRYEAATVVVTEEPFPQVEEV